MNRIQSIYENRWQNCHSLQKASCQPKFIGEIRDEVANLLKPGIKLLDIGCGDGSITNFARKQFAEIYGCDISLTALSHAAGTGLNTLCADLNADIPLPYQNEVFSAITCLDVLEHVIDPLHLLKDIHRVLCPQGQLLLSTPNIRYFRNLGQLIFKGTFPHTTDENFVWGGGHIHYFTTNDLESLIRNAGFKKISFHLTRRQFLHSWKRKVLIKLTGHSIFKDWFSSCLIAEVAKT